MPSPKPVKHVHRLKRHKFKSGNIIYFCVDDCRFKIAPALALGKTVLCNRCGEPFRMNEYSIRLAEPHCENCHKPKDGRAFRMNRSNLVIPPNKEEIELSHPVDLGVPLSERLREIVNGTKLNMEDDESEDEL